MLPRQESVSDAPSRPRCPHGYKYGWSCARCNKNVACPHGYSVSKNCSQCNPRLACPHGLTRKYNCKVCTPRAACPHGSVSKNCPKCHPNQACLHGRRKYSCKVCTPRAVCPHGRSNKGGCAKCSGASKQSPAGRHITHIRHAARFGSFALPPVAPSAVRPPNVLRLQPAPGVWVHPQHDNLAVIPPPVYDPSKDL